MNQRRALLISLLIILVYGSSGWIWYSSNSSGMAGPIIFAPFFVAYAAGYEGGDAVFWAVLLAEMFLLLLVTYGVIRSLQQPR